MPVVSPSGCDLKNHIYVFGYWYDVCFGLINEKPNERFNERDQPIVMSQIRHIFIHKT